MIVIRHRNFRKNFKSRILHKPQLVKRFQTRLQLFLTDPENPLLKEHKLTGEMKEFRAFWITGDIRAVYRKYGDTIELYDIGTHPQVYGM